MKMPLTILMLPLILMACGDGAVKTEADKIKDNSVSLMDNKDHTGSINSAREALNLYESISDTTGMIECLYVIARSSALSGDFSTAVAEGEKGSALCKLSENYDLEYKLNNILSWAYFTFGRGFEENAEHQKRQLFVVDQLNDDEAKAQVYNNYSYDGTVSGKLPLDAAVNYMLFANEYYAKTEGNKGRWYTLMNLTWQYRLKREIELSQRFGIMAMERARADSNRHAIVEAFSNLGETYLYQDKIEEAKDVYEEAHRWSEQEVDRDKYVFDIYYARYLWAIGRKQEAVTILKNAIDFLKNGEVFYEMMGRAILLEYSFESGEMDEVKKHMEIFKNPRANYYSLESRVMAMIVEAKLIGRNDPTYANDFLKSLFTELESSGAEFLLQKVGNALSDMASS